MLKVFICQTYMRKASLDYGRCDCSANGDGVEDHDCPKGGASMECKKQSL